MAFLFASYILAESFIHLIAFSFIRQFIPNASAKNVLTIWILPLVDFAQQNLGYSNHNLKAVVCIV